jgi:aryl-alcohol dehydrogenase-like predicted oxidoreductase
MFRQRPAELFFREAALKNVGVIVRVPLASGLLAGKFTRETVFTKDDHRFFNRNGEQFDKGETFSGIPYETGLAAVEELRKIFPGYDNLAPVALKWILMFKEVSCIIPGASRPDHVYSNLKAENEPEIYADQLNRINEVYDKFIRPYVYYSW